MYLGKLSQIRQCHDSKIQFFIPKVSLYKITRRVRNQLLKESHALLNFVIRYFFQQNPPNSSIFIVFITAGDEM